MGDTNLSDEKTISLLIDILNERFDELLNPRFKSNKFVLGELAAQRIIRKLNYSKISNSSNGGERKIEQDVAHYNLQMIIAVGFKVNSERAVQFRKWVNQIATEYTIKGWVMDDERLKRGADIINLSSSHFALISKQKYS